LRATYEALEELKCNNQSIQAELAELRRLLQEEKEEKQRLLCQLQAKDKALEKLQRDPCEVKINSSTLCIVPNDAFIIF